MSDKTAWLASQMPKECLQDFEQHPWIQKILSDPSCKEIPFQSRTITRNSSIHSLFNRTLATLDTLRACQAFLWVRECRENEVPDAEDGKGKKECLLLASMGRGLDGHPGMAHGGTIATLFDEGLSLGALQVLSRAFVTGQSTIKYKAAVSTPGIVLVRCWCDKFEGRKAWVKGTMEDGEGKVYAEGESLFIMVKEKL
ncbi:Acyl-coenzyme A thioesterase THEM4 [Pseudocercospora fuligena]|uniref:Acyl-coenzyme A thioesterase THEM4 n=1 Tax=Pseudocercospora fuligena TaxID=685502 RepID=A0A8H6VIS2_9PEZI|nr:Acyl-coenzyme A thioesterase THEM4 [Pseudocercospora fuligena]